MTKLFYFITVLMFCLSTNYVLADHGLTEKTNTLKAIANEISLLKKKLFSSTTRQENIKDSLKKTEISIGVIAGKINKNQAQLLAQQNLLTSIYNKKVQYELQLEKQKELLSEQTKEAYLLGRQPYLKIILNQENPEKISRYLHYYGLLNQARINSIHEIQQTTNQINAMAEKIRQQTAMLEKLSNVLGTQREAFKKVQQQRQYVLGQTNREIKDENQQLQRLQENKKRLEAIITELSLYGYAPGATFSQMRRKLHWPIAGGHIIQSYGQAIAGGRMFSTGILFQAKMGTEIHAVFPGKVVYADWLRGFGQLVIIQHGSSYMTLYARNQSLYVKPGENINAGQVIATVGNSGGFQDSALYFEIRYKAKPENPLLWLQRG